MFICFCSCIAFLSIHDRNTARFRDAGEQSILQLMQFLKYNAMFWNNAEALILLGDVRHAKELKLLAPMNSRLIMSLLTPSYITLLKINGIILSNLIF